MRKMALLATATVVVATLTAMPATAQNSAECQKVQDRIDAGDETLTPQAPSRKTRVSSDHRSASHQ
jgi:hypothetical protein